MSNFDIKLAPLHCVSVSAIEFLLKYRELMNELSILVATMDTHKPLVEPFIWNKFNSKYKFKLKKERRQIKTPFIPQWDSKIQYGDRPYPHRSLALIADKSFEELKGKGIHFINYDNLIDRQHEFDSGTLPVPGAEENLKKAIKLIQDSDKL